MQTPQTNLKSGIVDCRRHRRFRLAYRLAGALSKIPIRGTLRLGQLLSTLLLRSWKKPIAVTTCHGYDIVVSPEQDHGVDRTIYLTGTTERATLTVMRKLLRSGDVCVDVGANIGVMTLMAAQQVGPSGRVFAFEPCQLTATRLLENIALNGFSNVQVLVQALGASATKGVLCKPERHSGMSYLSAGGVSSEDHETVMVDTLDNLIASGTVRAPIRLVKIDVEGWEGEVVQGARNLLRSSDKPGLIIEWCPGRKGTGLSCEQIWEAIVGVGGYRLYRANHGIYREGTLVEVKAPFELGSFNNLFALTGEQAASI